MTGSEFYNYLLRLGFKRTDKETEAYEAITDAVQEMRRRFMFDGAEEDSATTDTISVLGDFKIDLESDFGLLLGVVMQDGDTAHPLKQRTKKQFDALYPDINVTADRGYPEHFSVFAGSIYIGPIPDSTSYVYRKSFSLRAGTVTSGTASVPFTDIYRDILAEKSLERLYSSLEEFEMAAQHDVRFEKLFAQATHRETVNSGAHLFTQRPTNF